ncbi:MAG TPA: hypothetical protein VGF79_10970 [Bacteroidia bacterium]
MNNKYINIFLFLFILNSAEIKALNKTQIPMAKTEIPSDSLRISHLNSRLAEIQSLNKKELSFNEKTKLKQEVKAIHKELRSHAGRGIYISAGALVVICILLIILL